MSFAEADLTRDAFLGGRLHLFQPRSGYRAATDPVLLAAAVDARPGELVLDLGCGGGTAVLCLMHRVGDLVAHGLEMQADYADLARRNAAANDLDLIVHPGDVAAMPAPLRALGFAHVLINPPYFGPGSPGADAGRERATRDEGALPVWIDAGLRRLDPGGSLTLILRTALLGEALSALTARAGEVAIKPLAARQDQPAERVIVQARKGRRGGLHLLAPLIMHRGAKHLRDGDDHSDQAQGILRDGHSLPMLTIS